jgi:hypothetical protein
VKGDGEIGKLGAMTGRALSEITIAEVSTEVVATE